MRCNRAYVKNVRVGDVFKSANVPVKLSLLLKSFILENMSDSENICLSCGCCCDGTVIGFVQLDSEELPVVRELTNIEEANGKGFILQPCVSYCDGCTIYAKRPKQCAIFKCGLLKSVEQNELDFDSAVEMIKVVNQKRIAIEKKLTTLKLELRSQSFYFKMVELRKLLLKNQSESSLALDHAELLSDIRHFDSLLSKSFGLTL